MWGARLVYFMLFLIPFQIFLLTTIEASLMTLTATLLLGVGVINWLLHGHLFQDELAVILLVLMWATLCSSLLASDLELGWELLYLQLWSIIPFFAVVQNLSTRQHLRQAILALLIGGVVVSIFGLAIMVSKGALLDWIDELRLTRVFYFSSEAPLIGSSDYVQFKNDPSKVIFGPFHNPDYFGSFLTAPALLGIVFVFFHQHSKWRALCGLATALIWACLLLTWGRGAILSASFGTSLMVTLLLAKCGKPWLWLVIALSICTLLCFYVMLPNPNPLSIYSDTGLVRTGKFTLPDIQRSLDLRLLLWSEGFQVVFERPWFGWGIESTRLPIRLLYGQSHSWYIETLIQFGIIGLGIRLLIISIAIRKCFAIFFSLERPFRENLESGVFLGLGCYLVAFLLDGVFNVPTRTIQNTALFWSVIGLVVIGEQHWRLHEVVLESTDSIIANSPVSSALQPEVLVMIISTIASIAMSVSIVYLTEYLHMLIVPLGLAMLGLCLMSTISWIRPLRWSF